MEARHELFLIALRTMLRTSGCGCSSIAECSIHGQSVLSRRQVGVCVVSGLVIVILDIQGGQFGKVNPQCATAIVDVL